MAIRIVRDGVTIHNDTKTSQLDPQPVQTDLERLLVQKELKIMDLERELKLYKRLLDNAK
jgi:hypothetical protein